MFLLFTIGLCLSFSLEILPLPSEEETNVIISGMVVETKKNYFFFQSGISRYYVYEKDTSRENGDVLEISGKREEFSETTYEGRFSFKEYLLSRGIKYSLKAYSITSKFNMSIRLRGLEKEFLSHFSESTASIIDNLLFGHRNSNDEFLKSASSLGILYLFSSSGVYLSFALYFFRKIGRKFLSEKGVEWSSFVFLLLLMPFHFQKVGFKRILLARLSNRLFLDSDNKVDLLGKASFVGLLLYLFSFRSPLQSAYLLGVGVSLNHAFSQNALQNLNQRKRKFFSSLSFHLFLFPIMIMGNSFHLFSYVYSLLLPPMILPFRSLCWLSFFSVPFPSFIEPYASFLASFVRFLEKIDITIPLLGGFHVYFAAFYYSIYYGFFYLSECGFHKTKKVLVLSFFITLILRSFPFVFPLSGEVTFINVGQGDAILIRDRTHTVLLDTGGVSHFDLGREVDVPYLYSRKITHLDAVVASHSDYDHIGAYSSLKSLISIDRYIDSSSDFPLKIGNMEFINLNRYGGEEENEKSLVLFLNFLGKRWLFMGDAPKEIEQKIIEDFPSLRCDVIKIGHHGSSTSSSPLFLKSVQPKEAIISVGARNNFGHPDPDVIKSLESLKITIRRTDLEGTIRYFSFL